MKLPEEFVNTYGENYPHVVTMFGVKTTDLSQKELLATVNFLIKDITETRERHTSTMNLMKELSRARKRH